MSDLKPQHSLFVDAYFETNMNGTKAAIQAGYGERSAHVTASRLLKNAKVRAEIERRLAEYAMPANEVLMRLTNHARGTMEDFIDENRVTLDLARADRAGRLHLVKKFTHTVGKETENISVELYDAQAALVQLGRYHGLFTDKTDLTTGGDKIEVIIRDVDRRD